MTEVLNHPDPSFLETRAAGSILHDFYSGIEKIFRRIASRIDRDLPTSDDWHTDLLKRMTIPLDGIRPSVINEELPPPHSLISRVFTSRMEWYTWNQVFRPRPSIS